MPRTVRYNPALVAFFIVVAVVAFTHFLAPQIKEQSAINTFKKGLQTNKDFSNNLSLYRDLLQAIGAVKAQEVLVATMPIEARTHMIDHETGKFLYKTEGMTGLAKCKSYLTGACYHGFMTAMVTDHGLSDVGSLFGACAEGLAADQKLDCAHGLGHAFLQYVGYQNLPQALALCTQAFPHDRNMTLLCHNGVFMENNFGEFSVPPPDRWYRADDPMYPCYTKAIMGAGVHTACWFMQSQLTLNLSAYPQFSKDAGAPAHAQPDAYGDIAKVGAYCGTLSVAEDQSLCFHGIGLQIQRIAKNNLLTIRAQCGKLGVAHSKQCVWTAAQTAYYFGDRSPRSDTLHVCETEIGTEKDACYEALYAALVWSHYDHKDQVAACRDLPEETYRASCAAWMESPAALKAANYETIVD
jgi:hypothetical protein